MSDDDVIVVGGGAAGLATARCLQERRISFQVLEASGRIGDSWRAHYDRLRLHTDRRRSGLPYRPWPRAAPRYPSRDQVAAYLDAYASALRTPPRLGVRVERAEIAGGRWSLRAGGETLTARALVVATGMCAVPRRPRLPGEERFGGEVIHSSQYASGARFAGRRALVVGFGNSGGEIAVDLVEQGAAAVRLAVRSPVNVIPREVLGMPLLAAADLISFLPTPLADRIARALGRRALGDLRALGLVPAALGPRGQLETTGRVPLIDVGTIALLRAGKLQVRPGVDSLSPGAVRFTDGREEPYDVVVLATGYEPRLERFLQGVTLDDRGGPPESGVVSGDPPLAFCGLRPLTRGMLRGIGAEARAIAAALAGRLSS